MGEELKPTKFDITKLNKPTDQQDSTDRFGQQYNSDPDVAKWSDTTPAMSRKMHLRADTDMSVRSIHHTLGTKHNQASPGDHIHDGSYSKKIGPLRTTATGNVMEPEWQLTANTVAGLMDLLHKFVEFRDA